jgi:hypothetical protein
MKLQHLANAMLEAKSANLPDNDNFYHSKNHADKNKLADPENVPSLMYKNTSSPLTADELDLAINIFKQLKIKFCSK